MTTQLTDADISALTRAIEIARLDPAEAKRIDAKLKRGEPWADVAASCAYSAQFKNLQLQPWENVPLFSDVTQPRRDEHAYGILMKLLSLNLSRYEPHPLHAIELAEAKLSTPAK